MDEQDFEGTLVLEKMAEIGKVDEFFAAIDADNLGLVKSLLKKAQVDGATIALVLQKIQDGDDA